MGDGIGPLDVEAHPKRNCKGSRGHLDDLAGLGWSRRSDIIYMGIGPIA
jgi:hypothetical protein